MWVDLRRHTAVYRYSWREYQADFYKLLRRGSAGLEQLLLLLGRQVDLVHIHNLALGDLVDELVNLTAVRAHVLETLAEDEPIDIVRTGAATWSQVSLGCATRFYAPVQPTTRSGRPERIKAGFSTVPKCMPTMGRSLKRSRPLRAAIISSY